VEANKILQSLFNYLNKKKSQHLFSVINTTLISNIYITDFPKEFFQNKQRRFSFFQIPKNFSLFYLKMSIKLSIFLVQKIAFSLFWRNKPKFENILIDKVSADLLKGSEVDYVSELIGDSFKISNPQSKSSCGCGTSFSL